MNARPDVIILMTDQERAAPPYEPAEVRAWRKRLGGAAWFEDHGVSFGRHYTGSVACVPSRPTLFTGQYPDVHGVTQTNGLGKMADDSRMRWLRPGEVPTLGHWFRAGGYDTHYQGKWHCSHADMIHSGARLDTNDDNGVVDAAAVQAYLEADPLGPFGFSGWVGPEPHGGRPADSGLVRDPLFADRAVAWLEDRYARRRAGDAEALRPFLLVASFVNPHDIVFAPAWLGRRGADNPLTASAADPPPIPPSPTDDEDLSTKPAAQIAYRASYPTTYGLAPAVERVYRNKAAEYRSLYYRLHAEVDGPLDRVRRAVTEGGSDEAVLVRTSDHGELLGAHGGLHQKWFNLYDEATRVPFVIARIGSRETTGRVVDDAPTSHVDLVPTLLGAAGIDAASAADELRRTHSEVHPLPGRDLMDVVDGVAAPDRERQVYLMTRDNMPEGDSGASAMARHRGMSHPPRPLRIQVPAHVGANFESLICRIDGARPAVAVDGDDNGDGVDSAGTGHLWKIVRTFDDPATWTEPGVRHLAADGLAGEVYRTEPLPDQWELYDLDADPIEAHNRWRDTAAAEVFTEMTTRLADKRARSVPERHQPWPYAMRRSVPSQATRGAVVSRSGAASGGSGAASGDPEMSTSPAVEARRPARAFHRVLSAPRRLRGHTAEGGSEARVATAKWVPPPARALRRVLQRLGMHPDDAESIDVDLRGRRALIVATNHGVLDIGKPTGVYASEMTVPYYAFVDAGMSVDVASPKGGVIPVDPQSLRAPLRTEACDRFLADEVFKGKVQESLPIGEIGHYDVVYLAGGWGAAFDLGFSPELGRKITEANEQGSVIGGVCHGPLGLLQAKAADGSPLVEGRRVTAVTDKQVRELRITSTPHHPETELRKAGALFESVTRFRDPFANHWVVDGNLVTGQNQNAAPMVAREMLRLLSHD